MTQKPEEYERFEQFARAIVRVPKKEVVKLQKSATAKKAKQSKRPKA